MANSTAIRGAVQREPTGPVTRRMAWRLAASAGALALGGMLAPSPAAAAECKFAPMGQINVDSGVEPLLLIDGTCTDPVYNERTFVVDKTEQLTFQVPGGPLIPYTEVTGHFPATKTLETLTPPVRQSPTTHQQNYIFRFPAKEFWRNRSMLQQHPTGGGQVDKQLAFTNGALTVNWMSASAPNHVASHRHQAAANLVAKAYANQHYGNTARIYSYMWGCSGGGIVGMAGAENVTGIWDGVQPQCLGPSGVATYHSFHWQGLYTAAIPEAKREAIAEAAAPGGTGDIYAGLNEEEKAVLTEFISAGYPLQIIGGHFKALDMPLVDPVDIRVSDPTYEDDFWAKPGYAGANPANWLKAAKIDGWATITGITRDASGAPTLIQFDPATVPPLGTIGDAYLEFWVYTTDGQRRLIDPAQPLGHFIENKRRFSLQGKFDHAAGTLTMTGSLPQRWGPPIPYVNSKILLDGLRIGGKVRVNNRFILAMYHYPRHSNIPGARSHDQYRNADGSPKHPQRPDLSILARANYRTMGGRIETGDIKTKTMIMEGMADNLSWPLFNASYAEMIQRRIGTARANQMMRFYLHDNGSHTTGGGEPGIFHQSLKDLMAWAEQGVAPPRSTQYTIRNGQVIAAPRAADRHGLQPVMTLTANGGARAVVGVNQPVALVGTVEMPPRAGQVVQYNWTVAGTADPVTNLEKPQPQASLNRTISFDKPGTYTVRLTVHGQRDGLVSPPDRTLLRNFKDVRVVVQ